MDRLPLLALALPPPPASRIAHKSLTLVPMYRALLFVLVFALLGVRTVADSRLSCDELDDVAKHSAPKLYAGLCTE
jgi:hypothetical protein